MEAQTKIEVEEELTLEQRYQLAGHKVLEVYGQCLQEGQYDMAWNKLSPALYNMRSLFFQMQQEQEQEN